MRIKYSHSKYGEKELPFSQENLVIGRRKSGVHIDLDLSPDFRVSRRHAEIYNENGEWWIKDLGSRNGTFVNDTRISEKERLHSGDKLKLGDTDIGVEWEEKVVIPEPEQEEEEPKEKVFDVLPSTSGIRAMVKCRPTMNYSLVHADVPFLSEVTLMNRSAVDLTDLSLRVILTDYGECQNICIERIAPNESYTLPTLLRFNFYRGRIRDISQPTLTTVKVEVNGKRVEQGEIVEVEILPPNAWHCSGHEVALAGFVMPDCFAVKEVLSLALRYLRKSIRGARGWADALESSDPKACEKTIKAIYSCLQEKYEGIIYEYEPRTYAPEWQKIRFHYELLHELQGTCIDLSLLFAACLECVHRDPVIIIVKMNKYCQHALIGCWRDDKSVGEPVISDQAKIQEWVQSGELFVLDSKGFVQTKGFPDGMLFHECHEKGLEFIENYPFCYAVDIIAARRAGITPMPFGKGMQFDKQSCVALNRAKEEARSLNSPAVGARHLLIGLLSLENGLLRNTVDQFKEGLSIEIIDEARNQVRGKSVTRRTLKRTKGWIDVINHAKEITDLRRESLVTEEMLTLALLETPSHINYVLKRFDITCEACLSKLIHYIEDGSLPPEWSSSGFIDTDDAKG